MAKQNSELDVLLNEPREALDVEVKEWLDLSMNGHRAALAKEIIALANHGGGYILVGFAELEDGTFVPSEPRPSSLIAWSQDAVQDIVAKYVEPAVQCHVYHGQRDDNGGRYPIISVPGGNRVPIKAKAGAPDATKLVANRIYVRRPGPNSEEPRTAEEWDRLIERCVQNRQDELIAAMRSIMAGVIPTTAPTTPVPTLTDRLQDFVTSAATGWAERVKSLPIDAPPRLLQGYYDFAVAIDGPHDAKSLSEMRDLVRFAVRNHSGWPPFLTLTRAPYAPKAVDGVVETWIGPDTDGSYDKPAHHDFWRVSPEGLLFTRRGFQEDGGVRAIAPGTSFDITTPTWRIGEAILEASYIAKALNAVDANLLIRCSWVGLKGRQLVSVGNPHRWLLEGRRSQQDTFSASATVAVDALPHTLPEVVFALLSPLYELFDFFELPKRLVEEELNEMQRQTFSG